VFTALRQVIGGGLRIGCAAIRAPFDATPDCSVFALFAGADGG